MNSHFYCSLFKTLAAVKRKGQRSWSLLPWLAMLASLIGPTGAWAADVTPNVASVSVAPSNPAAATAMNLAVIFELDTDAAIGDTIDFDIGGTAVAGTDYTAPTAHPTPPPAYQFTTTVAGTTHRLDIALLAGSVAGNTISVTSNSLTSNIATLTTGGATAVVSGSIQVLDDTATNINNGETLPIEIGTTTEGGTVSRTFTISNTSTEPLIVDISLDAAAVATTAINITAGGALSPEFSIVDPDTATAPDVTGSLFVVPAGTDVDFDVQFSPPVGTPAGSVDSVVTIVNSGSNIAAPDAPNFTFAIRGIVSTTPPAGQPEIDVYDGTIAEVEAGTAPGILDNTTTVVFPEATAGGEPIVKTFTIENPGTGDLSVTNLGFSPIITNFTRVDPFPSLVPFVDATTGVSPGRSEFQIQFDPAIIQPGTYEAQVIIDSNDSAFKDGIENPFNFPIQIVVAGEGVNVVDIEVWEDVVDTGTEVADNGVVELEPTFAGTAITKTFEIRNSTESLINLDLNSVTIQQNGLPFTLMLPADFPDFLAPGSTTPFDVQFNAPEVGSFNATIQIFNNSTGTQENPFDIVLKATAKSPVKEIQVSETTIPDIQVGDTVSFTSAASPGVVGTPITKTFTISNIGGTQLKINGISFKNGGDGLTLGSFSAKTLDPSGGAADSVEFEVTLNAENPGSYQDVIVIENDDEDESPFEFNIEGDIFSSLTEPEVTVWEVLDEGGVDEIFDEQEEVIDFSASTGETVSKTFKIKNIGGANLDLRILSPLPKGFSLPKNAQFPLLVESGQEVEFVVELDTSAPGSYGGVVEFFSTDADENPFSFPIGANVQDPAPEVDVLLEGESVASGTTVPVEFGPTSAGNAVTKVFTVENTGDAELQLSSLVTFSEGGDGFLITSFNPGPIAAGSSTSFTVLFNASEPGTYTGTLSFSNNDADENPYTFPVSGVIDTTAPATQEIEVWHGTIDNVIQDITDGKADTQGTLIEFPSTDANVAIDEPFTVKNIGSQDLFLTNLTITPDDSYFELLGDLPPVVAPGQAVEFKLRFNAPATGQRIIQLFNTDSDESPFDFPVKGVVNGDPGTGDDSFTLTVSRSGEGVVTSGDTNINCGTDATDCTADYATGTSVILTATADSGSEFKEWSGDCTDTTNPITVVIDAAKSCTAIFTSTTMPTETLSFTQPSNGNITTDVGGIICGTDGSTCQATYESGEQVAVTATADDGFTFSSWGGDCSAQGATNPTTLIMSESFSCSVNFSSVTPVEATLTFTKPDNGSISTADGKVNCGDTCTASYTVGETIEITASSLSAEFSGWEGDCSGTQNPLSVTITQDMVDQGWSCNATFANEATAEKDCFDVGLGLLVSGNECVQADELTTEDFTAAQMRGGISKFGRPFKQRDTVTLIDPIRTAGVIKVDPVDLGKPADIVVIGLHKSEELYPGVGFAWYMMIGDDSELGWTIDILPYDDEGSPQLEESVLPPLMSVSALTDYETIYMYSGNFVYPGPLELFYGYRIIGEKVVLNLEPIQVSILPPPK